MRALLENKSKNIEEKITKIKIQQKKTGIWFIQQEKNRNLVYTIGKKQESGLYNRKKNRNLVYTIGKKTGIWFIQQGKKQESGLYNREKNRNLDYTIGKKIARPNKGRVSDILPECFLA